MTLEFGTIQWFNPGRGFGILMETDRDGVPTGTTVLFHITGARNLLIGKDDVVSFADERLRIAKSYLWLKSGEGIVFEPEATPQGKRAQRWAFRSELSELMADIGEEYLPFEAVCYLVDTGERMVMWGGSNRYALSIDFPADPYNHLQFEVTVGDYHTEDDWDGPRCVYDEWTESMPDPRVELCCIPAIYWLLHGPLGVTQPLCLHGA